MESHVYDGEDDSELYQKEDIYEDLVSVAVVKENRKKNPDDANATEDCKKEGINEDLEANDVWITTVKTKLVLKKIMNRKKKFWDLSFSITRRDFNKC